MTIKEIEERDALISEAQALLRNPRYVWGHEIWIAPDGIHFGWTKVLPLTREALDTLKALLEISSSERQAAYLNAILIHCDEYVPF